MGRISSLIATSVQNLSNDDVIRNVYDYYIKHKDACKKYYQWAEDINIDRIYEQIQINDIEKEFPRVAIVILTANKYERNVLHSIYYNDTGKRIQRFNIELFPLLVDIGIYGYLFEWHGYVILNLHSAAKGSYTNGGSADLVRYIGTKQNLSPRLIISYGICFGVDQKTQNLGDTYLSDKIYPYFMETKITKDELFTSDNNMFKSDWRIMYNLKGRYFEVNKYKDIFNKDTPEFLFDTGNFITGEAVVSNQEFRDFFVSVTTQQVKAGEMEAYGMYKECSFIGIPCLTIKSICDWGVGKNDSSSEIFEDLNGSPAEDGELSSIKDSIQAITSANAAKAVESLLRNKMFSNSFYAHISDWIAHEYKEPGIYFETLLEHYIEMLTSIGKRIDHDCAKQFMTALISNLKDDRILREWENNMWIVER